MSKNNFTNENEFDFCWIPSESGYNPYDDPFKPPYIPTILDIYDAKIF